LLWSIFSVLPLEDLISERLILKMLYSSRLHHEVLFPISVLLGQNCHSVWDVVGLRIPNESIMNFSIFTRSNVYKIPSYRSVRHGSVCTVTVTGSKSFHLGSVTVDGVQRGEMGGLKTCSLLPNPRADYPNDY
jgi:hypothetical protein